jgi:hypothetical protein
MMCTKTWADICKTKEKSKGWKKKPDEVEVVKFLLQTTYIMMLLTNQSQWIVDKLQLKQNFQEEMRKHNCKLL